MRLEWEKMGYFDLGVKDTMEKERYLMNMDLGERAEESGKRLKMKRIGWIWMKELKKVENGSK